MTAIASLRICPVESENVLSLICLMSRVSSPDPGLISAMKRKLQQKRAREKMKAPVNWICMPGRFIA